MTEPEPSPAAEAAGVTGSDGWSRQRLINLASLLLPGLLAFGIDAVVLQAPLPHAVLLGVIPVAVGAITWSLTPRWELILAASVAASLWATLYHVPAPHLAGALVVGGLFLLPSGLSRRSPRLVPALLASLLAAGGAFLVTQGPTGALIAAAIGALAALLRPVAPTQETLLALRTASLYAPGGLLVGLLLVNAATGRMDTMTVSNALGFGVGLLALLALLTLVGLGLATLLGSHAPQQANAWMALAATAGIVAGSLVTRDPSAVLGSVAFGALALFPLATLLPARIASSLTSRTISSTASRWGAMLFATPGFLAVLQWLA